MTGKLIAEVSLFVDEQILVGQHHQCRINRRIAVRMIFHRITDHIGHLMKTAVIHLDQRMQNPPLHRFQPVIQMRNGTVFNNIRSVFQKVFIVKLIDERH